MVFSAIKRSLGFRAEYLKVRCEDKKEAPANRAYFFEICFLRFVLRFLFAGCPARRAVSPEFSWVVALRA